MTFRYARHSNNLKALEAFFTQIVGLDFLGSFEDHAGYNGIFLGKEGMDWHLEFTQSAEAAKHVFDEDDCLVFYPKTRLEYEQILVNIQAQNIPIISSKNPYWNANGICVLDPDGFRVIFSFNH